MRTQICRLNTKHFPNLKHFNDYVGAGKLEGDEASIYDLFKREKKKTIFFWKWSKTKSKGVIFLLLTKASSFQNFVGEYLYNYYFYENGAIPIFFICLS